MKRTAIILGLVFSAAACSGSSSSGVDGSGGGGNSAYDPMFSAPASSSATGDKVYGLWGGSTDRAGVKFDIRMRLDDGKITMAGRCSWSDGTSLTVGASGSARVGTKDDSTCLPPLTSAGKAGTSATCGTVAILESKNDRQARGEKYCTIDLKPVTWDFSMAGTSLELRSGADRLDFVKISD